MGFWLWYQWRRIELKTKTIFRIKLNRISLKIINVEIIIFRCYNIFLQLLKLKSFLNQRTITFLTIRKSYDNSSKGFVIFSYIACNISLSLVFTRFPKIFLWGFKLLPFTSKNYRYCLKLKFLISDYKVINIYEIRNCIYYI